MIESNNMKLSFTNFDRIYVVFIIIIIIIVIIIIIFIARIWPVLLRFTVFSIL